MLLDETVEARILVLDRHASHTSSRHDLLQSTAPLREQPGRSSETRATEQMTVSDGTAEDTEQAAPQTGTNVFSSYPDGGLEAWLQVFYCFCIFFTTLGGIYSWGVFQDALYATHLAPSSTLSFIGSTQSSLEALFAIPISRLVAAFGNRRVALVGAVLSGLGPILAGSCTTSVAGLIVTEGLIFGSGQALCFFCAATLPSTYFLRRRNLATGLVYAGAGLGGAVLALSAQALIKSVGLQWAFRTIGIMFLAINVPAAYFLKSRLPRVPLRRPRKREPGTERNNTAVDFSLFKDIRFVLVLIGGAVALFPLFVPPFFLPLFSTSIGLSSSSSSLILAGFNLASAFGRVGFGLGADAYLGSLNAQLLCLTTNAVSTLIIWPFAGSVAPLALFAVINGFCAGGFFSLMPGVVSTLLTDDQMPVAFSMIVSSWAPGYFLGAPIAGYILQAFGGPDSGYEAYRPAIFYSGGLCLFSALMMFGIRLKEGGSWRRKI